MSEKHAKFATRCFFIAFTPSLCCAFCKKSPHLKQLLQFLVGNKKRISKTLNYVKTTGRYKANELIQALKEHMLVVQCFAVVCRMTWVDMYAKVLSQKGTASEVNRPRNINSASPMVIICMNTDSFIYRSEC